MNRPATSGPTAPLAGWQLPRPRSGRRPIPRPTVRASRPRRDAGSRWTPPPAARSRHPTRARSSAWRASTNAVAVDAARDAAAVTSARRLIAGRLGRPGRAGPGSPHPSVAAIAGPGDDQQRRMGQGHIDGSVPSTGDHHGRPEQRVEQGADRRQHGPDPAPQRLGAKPSLDTPRDHQTTATPPPSGSTAPTSPVPCSSARLRRAASTPSTMTAASTSPAAASNAAS